MMKYVIIGYGNIGKKRHAVLRDKCVATVDPYQEADYKDYKDIPLSSFDCAVLSVSNDKKVEILEYLLKNKKHVLIEKPLLFLDVTKLNELNDIAKRNKVIWYTSYNHRFEPNIIKLKELLDKNSIGDIYFGNLIYGNGTVLNIKETWRDVGSGVLDDLGCHLIDIVRYLIPGEVPSPKEFKMVSKNNFESKSWDYFRFETKNGLLDFTVSMLMWKNCFEINLFGSKGSIHLKGLNKWGESTLTLRERVFPSGIPKEKIFKTSGDDKTWKYDIQHFEERISKFKSSYDNDLFILRTINKLSS